MENINILNKEDCTGCGMCKQLCPTGAIEMIDNQEGFMEPKIDSEKCINCGLCAKRCPQLNNENKVKNRLDEVKVYAAKSKNVEEQKSSSSGGLFSVIANYVLNNAGVVYGATFNDEMKVEHIRVAYKKYLYKLRGSKYVQSDTKNTFQEAKKDLEKNILVLYSGTPCQIAGLISFLNKDYSNLILIDLICHGVPSPKLLAKQIEDIENKKKDKIVDLEFRNKEKEGWGAYCLNIKFANGRKKYIPSAFSPYITTFLQGKLCRYSCYNCKYANTERMGDITLGDYWGIKQEHPEFYDVNGVSALLVNTEKGEEILRKISNNVIIKESTLSKVKKANHNLNEPTQMYSDRENVYKGLDKDFKSYAKENLKYKVGIKNRLKRVIPRKLKNEIKKIIE